MSGTKTEMPGLRAAQLRKRAEQDVVSGAAQDVFMAALWFQAPIPRTESPIVRGIPSKLPETAKKRTPARVKSG